MIKVLHKTNLIQALIMYFQREWNFGDYIFSMNYSPKIYRFIILFPYWSWSISASYFAFHGYPYTDFLEYPLLLSQQIVLIFMHLKFNKIASIPTIVSLILAYLVAFYYMTLGPKWFLQLLIVSHLEIKFAN